jgi:hypothetical protein
MEDEMPEMYRQLVDLRNRLESHYREVQDFEYTIEKGTLYCLQTRNGKMNATARVRTSVEMVNEGLINRDEALLRVDPEELEQLLHPMLDPEHTVQPVAVGLPASPGGASGAVAFDADRAELLGRAGEKIILVREETKPEDIHGFFASRESSPAAAARPRMPRLWLAAWASPAWQARKASPSISAIARHRSVTRCCTRVTSSPSMVERATFTSVRSRRSTRSFPLN